MRILLAERDEGLAVRLERELQKMHFTVERVSGGTEAEARLASRSFDAVLLGWDLPRKSGCAVLSDLRAARNAVPVLMIAHTDTLEERVASFNSGADDFLSRPVQTEELAARLNAVIRRSLSRPDKRFRCGALVYDGETRLFHLNDAHLAVTPREHEILSALIERAGHTVARGMLVQRMDAMFANQSTGIENLVHRVRKKLGSGFVTIETVREVGYRLVETQGKSAC